METKLPENLRRYRKLRKLTQEIRGLPDLTRIVVPRDLEEGPHCGAGNL